MKVYNKLVLSTEDWSILEEDSFEYSGLVEKAAGGMLTKQADFLTARYLNDVNDTAVGGVIVSLPAGCPSPSVSQTLPGDRIVLDDITALALSDTTVGTLYGGVYCYGKVIVVTQAVRRGGIAFFAAADLGVQYAFYSDAQPSTSQPCYIAGIWINSTPINGNYAWIQVAGAASVLFDSTLGGTVAAGNMVDAKASAALPATAEVGATVSQLTVACLLGVAVGIPTTSTVTTVMLTRGNFMGRI